LEIYPLQYQFGSEMFIIKKEDLFTYLLKNNKIKQICIC